MRSRYRLMMSDDLSLSVTIILAIAKWVCVRQVVNLLLMSVTFLNTSSKGQHLVIKLECI